MNSFKNNDYIDIFDILRRVWVYKLPVIALAILVAVLCVIRVEFFVEDQFVSSGMLYVSNQKADADEDEKALSQSDINTAKSLSATYREILKTRSFLAEVENEIGGKYSWKQIKSMVSVSAVSSTELIQIAVVANTREDAYLIADAMINQAPDKLEAIFGNGTVKIVDEAAIPTGAVGKGTMGEAVKGGAIGLFIGLAIVVVIGLFDTKIRKSEDVAKRYNISILGEVAQ